MMTDQEILSNLKGIFNACLSSGLIKKMEEATALNLLLKEIETRLYDLQQLQTTLLSNQLNKSV